MGKEDNHGHSGQEKQQKYTEYRTRTRHKYIADTAQQLVADLNDKRNIDSQLLESFRQSLEQEMAQMLETVQQQMFQSYEAHSAMVDQKLQELFACLDKISATEAELHTFRQSLKNLYQEMNGGFP